MSISLPFCSTWVEGARKNSGLSSRFLSTRTRTRIRLGLLFGRLADDPRPDVLKSVGCERRLRFSSELGAGGAPRSSVRPDRLSQTAHSDVVARRSINSESACWPEHLFRNRRPALPSPGSARLTLSLSCTRAKNPAITQLDPLLIANPTFFPPTTEPPPTTSLLASSERPLDPDPQFEPYRSEYRALLRESGAAAAGGGAGEAEMDQWRMEQVQRALQSEEVQQVLSQVYADPAYGAL